MMPRLWFVDVGVMQYAGVAVFMENYGFHDTPPQMGNAQSAGVSLRDMLEVPAGAVLDSTLRPGYDLVQVTPPSAQPRVTERPIALQ